MGGPDVLGNRAIACDSATGHAALFPSQLICISVMRTVMRKGGGGGGWGQIHALLAITVHTLLHGCNGSSHAALSPRQSSYVSRVIMIS